MKYFVFVLFILIMKEILCLAVMSLLKALT